MTTNSRDGSLQALERLIAEGKVDEVEAYLERIPTDARIYWLGQLPPDLAAALLELLSDSRSELAAILIEHLLDSQAADVISMLPPEAAAAIVEAMDSDDRADIVAELDDEQSSAILSHLPPVAAEETRRLASYAPHSAGGLMITEYLAHPMNQTISDVLQDLRANASDYARYDVQYVYVTDAARVLVGVIRLRDLVLSPGEQRISEIMIANPAHVRVDDEGERLQAFFDEHAFFAAPVVDDGGRLVGVLRRAAVQAARAERADRALLAFGGIIGGEELRSMPMGTRTLRRLAFLGPNILLNLVAASVVALYEPTIAAVTALAIFLPMLSDMSGCAGNQAVAVSIRELSLGLLRPRDLWLALRKEIGLGAINGAVLGGLIGAIAWLMRGGQWPLIGVVVGGAMAMNSVVAVAIGGTVPLLLKRLGVDPALAASPILTTFTDLCGFFLTLKLATVLLL
ncbi:MAG: magnesium transporter [Polyangiaceae bacterium]